MIFTNSSKHQSEVAYFFENTTTAILDVSIAFNNSAPIFSPLGRLLSSSKAWIVLRSKAAKRWLVNVVRISAPRKLTKTSYSYVNFGVDEDGAKEGAMVATHRPNRGNTLAPAKTQTAKQQKLVVSFFGFLSSSSFWFPSSFSSSFFCKFSKVVWHSFFCNFSKVVWIVGSYFHKRRKKLFLFFFWWNRKHIVIDSVPFWQENFVPVTSPAQSTPLFHLGLNSGWFRAIPVSPVDFTEFRPIYQFQPVLKSNSINPSCHSTGHLKKRISSQQSSFSSSLVFQCVSSSATFFFLILAVAIFCPVQLFIVLSFVFCNIIFSFVSLYVTSLD